MHGIPRNASFDELETHFQGLLHDLVRGDRCLGFAFLLILLVFIVVFFIFLLRLCNTRSRADVIFLCLRWLLTELLCKFLVLGPQRVQLPLKLVASSLLTFIQLLEFRLRVTLVLRTG